MNGTTNYDRTNYFETLPANQLELALWLEADRMGYLLDALSQENLDNQRDVVRNERRSAYDNRPYGRHEELLGAALSAGASRTPLDHRLDGRPRRGARSRTSATFFRTYYAPNNAVLSIVGDVETASQVRRSVEHYFGAIPANPDIPSLGDLSLPAILGAECARSVVDRVPLPRVYCRLPVAGLRRPASRCARPGRRRSWPAARAAGSTGAWFATSRSPRTSRSSPSGSSAARRSRPAGRPSGPGVDGRRASRPRF